MRDKILYEKNKIALGLCEKTSYFVAEMKMKPDKDGNKVLTACSKRYYSDLPSAIRQMCLMLSRYENTLETYIQSIERCWKEIKAEILLMKDEADINNVKFTKTRMK